MGHDDRGAVSRGDQLRLDPEPVAQELRREHPSRLPLREHTQLDPDTMEIMMRMKLEIVSLSGFEHLMPSELSGGMIKRAAFARAIIMDPALLFCDEPSAGLDPVVSRALDELILRLRDAMRMTIVVVTHELDSAFRIADRITVLAGGRVIAQGTPDEIKGNPKVVEAYLGEEQV